MRMMMTVVVTMRVVMTVRMASRREPVCCRLDSNVIQNVKFKIKIEM